jgi:arginine deiminase
MEIERLTHENMRQFLFEDVPFLRRAQEEHDAFVSVMRDHGINVLYVEHFLRDLLADESTREPLIRRVCAVAAMPAIADELIGLRHWTVEQLVEMLFAGLTAAEYAAATGRRTEGGEETFLLPPIPNAYFCRDPAVVVRDAAICSKMHFRERVRETVLTQAVLECHPEFRDNLITYGGSAEPTEDRPYTIEGGDVVVLSPDAVLVGASERTRSETIERVAGKCFAFGKIQRVYEIPIPTERAFMHLDTVFTVLDRGVILWYPDVFAKLRQIHRYEPAPGDARTVIRSAEARPLLDVLRDEFGVPLTLITTGGGKQPFARREQRMDGANALAIAPRMVIAYERNERTITALREHGFTCIGIDDSELVRGLGGPRCMTMPLRRVSP